MIFVRGEVSPTAVTPKVTVVDLKPTFTYSVLQFLLLGKGNNYTPLSSARLWESCQRTLKNPCSSQPEASNNRGFLKNKKP